MKFHRPLQNAKLERRYKRFLADVTLETGEMITIHCPNTGSMRNCADPGFGVWLSESDNKKRKYKHTWELAVDFSGQFIGVNTTFANKVVKEALLASKIEELVSYQDIQSEVKYGEENSRIDFFLQANGLPNCYLEVKSVTLNEQGLGYFPDAVSTRGQKHLRELEKIATLGHRAILFYCVQHTGIASVSPARNVDPEYASALESAVAAGVEVLAYGCEISPEEIEIARKLPFILS